MGQKIHPIGFRLSVNKNWSSRWYANSKNFASMLNEDLKVRDYLKKRLSHASVGKVIIERPAKDARITIHSARARRRDRQEGRGHRDPQGRPAQAPRRADGARQHRGNPQARGRRAADRRFDRAAAREAHHVPPRHEARDAERDAPRRAGHQDHERGSLERHRDRAHRVVPRGTRSAAYAARRHRLRNCRGEDHLRRDRHQVLGVQGRGDGQGRPAGRGPRAGRWTRHAARRR